MWSLVTQVHQKRSLASIVTHLREHCGIISHIFDTQGSSFYARKHPWLSLTVVLQINLEQMIQLLEREKIKTLEGRKERRLKAVKTR
jgi:hypothetical protein